MVGTGVGIGVTGLFLELEPDFETLLLGESFFGLFIDQLLADLLLLDVITWEALGESVTSLLVDLLLLELEPDFDTLLLGESFFGLFIDQLLADLMLLDFITGEVDETGEPPLADFSLLLARLNI